MKNQSTSFIFTSLLLAGSLQGISLPKALAISPNNADTLTIAQSSNTGGSNSGSTGGSSTGSTGNRQRNSNTGGSSTGSGSESTGRGTGTSRGSETDTNRGRGMGDTDSRQNTNTDTRNNRPDSTNNDRQTPNTNTRNNRNSTPNNNTQKSPNSTRRNYNDSSRAPDNTGINSRDRQGRTLTPEDQSGSTQDRVITQHVRELIMDEDLSTNAKNIKIITMNGVVTLRGPVNSLEEKNTIQAKADQAQGVSKIDNQLEVIKR